MLGGGWNRCVRGGWMGGRLGLRAGSLWSPRGVGRAGREGGAVAQGQGDWGMRKRRAPGGPSQGESGAQLGQDPPWLQPWGKVPCGLVLHAGWSPCQNTTPHCTLLVATQNARRPPGLHHLVPLPRCCLSLGLFFLMVTCHGHSIALSSTWPLSSRPCPGCLSGTPLGGLVAAPQTPQLPHPLPSPCCCPSLSSSGSTGRPFVPSLGPSHHLLWGDGSSPRPTSPVPSPSLQQIFSEHLRKQRINPAPHPQGLRFQWEEAEETNLKSTAREGCTCTWEAGGAVGSQGPRALCHFKWGPVDSQRGQEEPRGVPSTLASRPLPSPVPLHPDHTQCPVLRQSAGLFPMTGQSAPGGAVPAVSSLPNSAHTWPVL